QELTRVTDVGKGGKEAAWKGSRLEMPFQGNRVDLILASGTAAKRVQVLIDGRKPGDLEGAYRITRPTPNPWAGPFALVRVDHDAPLVAETWTLKVTSAAPDSSSWAYAVTGSITGPDGNGDSRTPFVSGSRRVKIAPDAFFRGFGKEVVPVGYEVKWQVLPQFRNEITPLETVPDPSRESAVTVAQGIPNGAHTLTLIADSPRDAASIRAIRVYRPPVEAQGL
ncbi:MAG: SGNH/GDSL hydrolase family protein, partial [Cytophagales bacterium]|nr:SGNH/GDSL hydrolase family protein [Armatimonadota bacterium]